MSHLDSAWLLGEDIAGCIILFFETKKGETKKGDIHI